MKLGAMIRALSMCKPDVPVMYDFCGLAPTNLKSWRGIYAELALGYGERHSFREGDITVGKLLAELKGAIGKTYTGYKGGDYMMDEATEVHCDNYGESTDTAIVGIRDLDYYVVIETRHES